MQRPLLWTAFQLFPLCYRGLTHAPFNYRYKYAPMHAVADLAGGGGGGAAAPLSGCSWRPHPFVHDAPIPSCPWSPFIIQARSQGGGVGGGGGVGRPPPVAHPKDFVPPFSNFVPPFSNFVPPFSNFVPPFSNFVPPFSKCSTLGICGWRHTGNVQGGGGACECPRVGAFFKLMTSRGKCPRGGVRLVFHPSKFRPPPHLAGWLRAW